MVKKAYTTYKVRCDRHSYNGNQIKGHDWYIMFSSSTGSLSQF
jgi:hypothetical protein